MRLKLEAEDRASTIWVAIALLAPVAIWLLMRNIFAIGLHVPLDPNEGWNAAFAALAMGAGRLYPSPQSFMVNNYPPLSFYAVGALGKWSGDFILSGRILSVISFLLIAVEIGVIVRAMGSTLKGALFAALFFASVLLITSNYVGMDDPQLMAHAVQLLGLIVLFRGRIIMAALLMSGALFIKHNLLALPLAAIFWLLIKDVRAAIQFFLTALGLNLALITFFRTVYETSLLDQIASPRLYLFANLKAQLAPMLAWAALPLLALLALKKGPYSLFCMAYSMSALLLGILLSAGDGVDCNIFFDLAIALSLSLGLVANEGGMSAMSAVCALPLLIVLGLNFADNNFYFTADFAQQSEHDIALLRSRKGLALCQDLSLCLWAGKKAQVDVFNLGEAIKTGSREPAQLIKALKAHRFTTLQLEDINVFGPKVRQVIEREYQLDHSDDNGIFLTARARYS